METLNQRRFVTFEQAKLLKEKGFNQPVSQYYFDDGEFRENFIQDTYGYYGDEYEVHLSEFYENWNDKLVTTKSGSRCFGCNKSKNYFETFSAPEEWQVVEWLRINHDIYIVPFPELLNGEQERYYPAIFEKGIGGDIEQYFDTPQEAYLVAFDYVLNEILK
jgi:hypothetical protein